MRKQGGWCTSKHRRNKAHGQENEGQNHDFMTANKSAENVVNFKYFGAKVIN
jgi:hypothetical protein